MANLLICWIMMTSFCLQAVDLGTYGQLFEIKEMNLLDYLCEKSQSLSRNELTQLFEQVRPQFHANQVLQTAITYRRFYFDPTVCAQEDILNQQGILIVAKGQCANPLDYTSLSTELLFLDGNNISHIEWAKRQSKEACWILTNGSPLTLEEKEKRSIYFDQQGVLAQKLALTFLPAKVSQSGKLLLIEEFPVEVNP